MKMLSWLHAHIIDVTAIDSLLSQLHVLLILSVSQQLRQIKISQIRKEGRIEYNYNCTVQNTSNVIYYY